MKLPRGGLTALPDADLQEVVRRIYRGQLPCPFTRADLLARGMNRTAEEGDLIIGLGPAAVRAVVRAVLAERRPR